MAIVRTAAAECDARNPAGSRICEAYQSLDPQSTQHFRDLRDLGWTNELDDSSDEILTYCPHHSVQPQEA